MPRYTKTVEAVQWNKPGDHPLVTVAIDDGRDYGWIGPYLVIPGDWIVTDATGTYRVEDAVFKETYKREE